MKSTTAHRKQTASFTLVNSLAIALLWLMLAANNSSAYAQASSPADWTQFHTDNMQRWNPNETILGVNNIGGLGLKWSDTENPVTGPPAVANGVIYYGALDGNVYARNAGTGAKLWSYATGFVASSPAVANGVVYVASFSEGNVYALNASTGTLLWKYATQAAGVVSPAVANGVVYFADNFTVYALNAGTGSKLWSFATGNLVESSPAVANGVVYIGSNDDNVYALNATTGAKLWSYNIGVFVSSSPAVANGVVYIGDINGMVYALNASTGDKLWSFATVGAVQSAPGVANGVVYVGSSGGNLYALNASTGALQWSSFTSGFATSPAVANGVVYTASSNSVSALNASTGAKLWSFATGSGERSSSPVVANGVVYVNSEFFFAFGLGTSGTADLFLRIFPTPTTVHQGDLITYAFPVWNFGGGSAVKEVLNTQVPAGTTFDYIRISGTPGLGTCTTPPYQGTGQIVCHENASMAPNTTWTVRLTVKVTAPTGTVITENAATMSDTPDPNMANNTATVSLTVQ